MGKKNKAFVVGFPINHSLSPFIHGFWLKTYKIEGFYEACAIKPENFADFITTLKEKGFAGGNVTLPYKEQAYLLADYCDDAAKSIGAANGLWFEKGKLCASNSDAYGFSRNLDDFASHWCEGQTALVLGAGGAARAVIFALKQQGFKTIFLSNRTLLRAQQLAEHFGSIIHIVEWQNVNHYTPLADLIINTTSMGLTDNKAIFPIDFKYAQRQAIVTDIVYLPLQTPFLQAASIQGLTTVDGLGMLLHQAVFGFERWFGVKPVVSGELRALILAKLADRNQ